MTSFNDRVIEKVNALKDMIVVTIGSLQNMKSLLTHHDISKKPSLAVEGHTKSSSIGLSDGGFCAKCGKTRRLQQKKQKMMD